MHNRNYARLRLSVSKAATLTRPRDAILQRRYIEVAVEQQAHADQQARKQVRDFDNEDLTQQKAERILQAEPKALQELER